MSGAKTTQERIYSGDIVIDRDDDSPHPAVVVKRMHVNAEDWSVPGGTVADTNPDYPADDNVIVVVYRDDLEEEFPLYSGGLPLAIAEVSNAGLDHYSFPRSRLRRIDQLDPYEIALDDIDPCPYHARNFSAEANRDYIDAIRDRGHPDPPPVVRVRGDRFELINGHKRVWASHVAGLESIPCDIHYEPDLYAARTWARYHLNGYTDRQRQAAFQRIESRLDTQQARYIAEEYLDSSEEEIERWVGVATTNG